MLGLADLAFSPMAVGGLPRLLVALAALCVAILAVRRAPSLAWLAAIGGSFVAATIPIDLARIADPGQIGIGPWIGIAVPASLAAVLTMGIGSGYAIRRGRRLDPVAAPFAVGLLIWLVVACATTIGLIAGGQSRADPAFTWVDLATAPISLFLHLVVLVTALGAVADVRAGLGRAFERLSPPVPAPTSAARAWALAIATIRELVPGQAAAEEATVAAERTRLAGDLHAIVLPGLRRAIAEAESGGDPETLARHLRTVDLDLERLMADRWPVVLEAFGLVAALEDLAERVEAESRIAVHIDVERAGERPSLAIERAAWRVAQIAIDNAVRHADPAVITLTVSVDLNRVGLVIADDGRGFDPDAAVRSGARGLADSARRATAVGATVRVEPRPGGGTMVAFKWTGRRP